MAQFSMEIICLTGSVLRGNQHAQVTSEISWWPRELSPQRFEKPPNSTIVSALITMTDDSGRLPHLVAALAEANPSNSRLQSLARLSMMIVDWLSFSRNSGAIEE